MGDYGGFDYGGGVTGDNYGTGIAVELLTWYFGVFWDDAFIDETGIMMDLQVDRGRDHLLSTSGAWERFKAGEAVGLFDNSDGRFDPYNTGSPLFGFLLPGRVVRITVAVRPPYLDTTTTFDVLRGIIDDMDTFVRNGQRLASIVVKDGLEWLAERSIALALVEDAQALVTAAAIATQVGFDDVDDWTIEQLGASSVVVPFTFGSYSSAIELINELVDAEAGQVFHSKSGILTLVTNDYTELDTTDIDDAQGHITRDFELKQPWKVVRTRAKITIAPLVTGASAVVWTFGVDDAGVTGTPFLLIPEFTNSSQPVDAIFSGGNPVDSPTVSDLYAERAVGGVDVSAEVTKTVTDIGNGVQLTFNRSGSLLTTYFDNEIFIYWVEVTATPYERSDDIILTASDLAAAVIYGEKTFELDNPWIQDATYAQAYADYIIDELAAARLFPTIQIEGRGLLQYGAELYVSKVHLTIPALGIDDTFRVGKISHRWINDNGLATRTTLKLEPVLGSL